MGEKRIVLKSINDLAVLFSNVNSICRDKARKESVCEEAITKGEKEKINNYISKMITFYQGECDRINHNFIEEIDEIYQEDGSYSELIKNSLDILNEFDQQHIFKDYQHYRLEPEFKYSAPSMCTEVIIKNLIKTELIDKLKDAIFQKEIWHKDQLLKDKPINKILTSFTVKELIYFFKVLYEKEIIILKHDTELFRFIKDSFLTMNSKNISEQSLKNHFYNISPETIKSVQSKIREILLIIARDKEKIL